MNSQELLSIYGTVANITDKMVSAALSNDWALLSQLEANCSTHVQAIKDNVEPIVLADDELKEKIRVISKILADDRKIRDIINPRMARLGKLMHQSSTKQKLTKAYSTPQLY